MEFLFLAIVVVAIVILIVRNSGNASNYSPPSGLTNVVERTGTRDAEVQPGFSSHSDEDAWLNEEPDQRDDEWALIMKHVHGEGLDYAEDFLQRIPAAQASGDSTFRGKGMTFYRGNWTGLYKKLRARGNRERVVNAVLVPEPQNQFDRTAVAITVHGRVIGHVPAEMSSSVFRFIMDNGGLIKVLVSLWFDPGITKNSIQVHISPPYRMQDKWQTDLKPIFWTSQKYGNKLVAFVEND